MNQISGSHTGNYTEETQEPNNNTDNSDQPKYASHNLMFLVIKIYVQNKIFSWAAHMIPNYLKLFQSIKGT